MINTTVFEVRTMSRNLVVIDSSVLPSVYIKVLEAKELLSKGKASSLAAAAKMVGISRSALYKYKDSVFSYSQDENRVSTLFLTVVDERGILSKILSIFTLYNANILTINQNIPSEGVAGVSISYRQSEDEDLRLEEALSGLDGIIKVKRIG